MPTLSPVTSTASFDRARSSGPSESLLKATRQRQVDVIVVLWLDRWGRSFPDLVVTLRELIDLGVGSVSLTEALDLNTPTEPGNGEKVPKAGVVQLETWVQNAHALDKVNNKLRQILNSLVPVTMHDISGFGRRPSPKCGF
jgi:Resolvase, N terminal domain